VRSLPTLAAGALLAPLVVLLASCATPAPTSSTSPSGNGRGNGNGNGNGNGAEHELACTLPSNCVNSLGTGALAPLRFGGTPAQALATLQAALATFPEARVVKSQPLALEVIFTTPIGFRDQVDFRIDAAGGRIDFRSRSLFGLFDFGKNHSRMAEFSARFAKQPPG
jgi:uncharacterized protein (DUF1499 family)